MREMILNHASVGVYDSSIRDASEHLRDVTVGMGQLVRCGAVGTTMRIASSGHEILQSGYSLYDVWVELQGRYRDESKFFGQLLGKSKSLDSEQLIPYEERTLPAGEGLPLIFAAIEDGVLIGFPSEPRWDCDQLVVEFDELLPDGDLDKRSEEIDQLTRASHAASICDRHRSSIAEGIGNDPIRLWEKRQNVFPHIQFGLDVEQHLKREANHLLQIIKKLKFLDQAGKEWAKTGGSMPPWGKSVSPESDSVMSNRVLRGQRYFRSQSSSKELFEWHTRFAGGGRIHLRFNAATRTIEIGYIGPHLPL